MRLTIFKALYVLVLLLCATSVNTYGNQMWQYDAVYKTVSNQSIEFQSQSQHYDGTANLCHRCINSSVENLQEKVPDGSFFAFEVSFFAPKSVDPKVLIGRQGRNEMSSNQVKKLRRKIREEGFDPNQPIDVADVNGKLIILDGHHRTKAAIGAGLKNVPVNIQKATREQGDQLLIEAAEALGR